VYKAATWEMDLIVVLLLDKYNEIHNRLSLDWNQFPVSISVQNLSKYGYCIILW